MILKPINSENRIIEMRFVIDNKNMYCNKVPTWLSVDPDGKWPWETNVSMARKYASKNGGRVDTWVGGKGTTIEKLINKYFYILISGLSL